MTFSSQAHLDRKTGAHGVGRFKYLQSLVTEFQDTHRKEFKVQVLANLANFAYDPINYEHFRKLNVIDIFLDVMAEGEGEGEGGRMVEFAVGGLCNCGLDGANMSYLTENDGIPLTIKCLTSSNEETVLSAITTLIYLTTPETKKRTTPQNVQDLMKQFCQSQNPRLRNVATVFLEDCCGQRIPAATAGAATIAAIGGPPVKKTKLE